jgi:hypothetical protein
MDRKAILQRIGEIIADLNEQYQQLEQHPDQFGQLEMELFAANAKFLADHTLILQKLDAELPAVETPMETEKVVVGVLDDLPELDEETSELIDSVPVQPAVTPAPPPQLPAEPIVTQSEPIPTPTQPEVKPTLNDLMGGRNEQNLAAKFSQEPIADLKSSISLNDKLVFIKDLFSGYSLAYQEALDTLNKLEDFAAADQYLQSNYVEQHKWAEKQATADRFYALLGRRFAK